jgi:hypothetical protein
MNRDAPIAAFELTAAGVLGEKTAPTVGHEHRVLPVIVVFWVLFAPVDQRRLVALVVPQIQPPVGLEAVLAAIQWPLWRLLAGLHPLGDDYDSPRWLILSAVTS